MVRLVTVLGMTATRDELFGRVLCECALWGVEVVQHAPANIGACSKQPESDTWIEWPARVIYQPDPHPLALLHELGHAVSGIDPRSQRDEVGTGVFAFEVYEQRRLRLGEDTMGEAWRLWMRTYGVWEPAVNDTVSYFEASAAARDAELQLSLEAGVRLGVLQPDGSPTYVAAPVRP